MQRSGCKHVSGATVNLPRMTLSLPAKRAQSITASEYAFILYPIKNAEAINKCELAVNELAVKATDDLTLSVEFERPTAYFTKLTAFSTYFPYERTSGNLEIRSMRRTPKTCSTMARLK